MLTEGVAGTDLKGEREREKEKFPGPRQGFPGKEILGILTGQ